MVGEEVEKLKEGQTADKRLIRHLRFNEFVESFPFSQRNHYVARTQFIKVRLGYHVVALTPLSLHAAVPKQIAFQFRSLKCRDEFLCYIAACPEPDYPFPFRKDSLLK